MPEWNINDSLLFLLKTPASSAIPSLISKKSDNLPGRY
ncbi:hypothetical protein BN439_3356 [Erwinia amylovora Ea644]|nr:hypothetical protein BN439_3356 [Erwinia amylovora Ea644]